MDYNEAYRKFQKLSQAKRKEYVALHKEGKTNLIDFMIKIEEKAKQLEQQHVEESLKSRKSESLHEQKESVLGKIEDELDVSRILEREKLNALNELASQLKKQYQELVGRKLEQLDSLIDEHIKINKQLGESIKGFDEAIKILNKRTKAVSELEEAYKEAIKSSYEAEQFYKKSTIEFNKDKMAFNKQVMKYNKDAKKLSRRIRDFNRREGFPE